MEPVPSRRRAAAGAARADGGRVREAGLGVRSLDVRVPARRLDRGRRREPGAGTGSSTSLRVASSARSESPFTDIGACAPARVRSWRSPDRRPRHRCSSRSIRRRWNRPGCCGAPAWRPSTQPGRRVAESITFPSAGGRIAHALFYRPTNPDVAAPDGERPPLVVLSHGGPTSHASTALDLGIQLLTSRGIAVVDVDYGGSTGYGREYRRELDGDWGVVDVDDCEAAAQFLVDRGDVDPDRLAIEGGSAGGYTTLAALAFRDTFAAGISLFGIGDLEALVHDHPQVRVALHRPARRPVPGDGRAVPRAVAEPPPRRDLLPGARPPGPRGPGRPAAPGRGDRRGPDGQRHPACVPRVRGRGPRLPRRRRHPAHAGGAALLPGRGVRLHAGDVLPPLEVPGLADRRAGRTRVAAR